MSRPLIGLAGLARSGKDTFAEYLVTLLERKGIPVETYAFADPLKRAASEMFGIPVEIFYGGDERELVNKDWGISPRVMLQKLGTEGGRNLFRQDIWTKRAEVQYNKQNIPIRFLGFSQPASIEDIPFVVTDVRFEDEAQWIRDNGGTVLHIVRDAGKVEVIKHSSENGVKWKEGDLTIYNTLGLKELISEAELYLEQVNYFAKT